MEFKITKNKPLGVKLDIKAVVPNMTCAKNIVDSVRTIQSEKILKNNNHNKKNKDIIPLIFGIGLLLVLIMSVSAEVGSRITNSNIAKQLCEFNGYDDYKEYSLYDYDSQYSGISNVTCIKKVENIIEFN